MRKTRVATSTIRIRAVITISSMVLLTLDGREGCTCCPVDFCAGVIDFADVCREPSVVGEFCACIVVGGLLCDTGGSVEMGAIKGRAVG